MESGERTKCPQRIADMYRSSLLWLSSWLSSARHLAGMDGNRTHPGPLSSAPRTVLKTAGLPSGAVHQPPPERGRPNASTLTAPMPGIVVPTSWKVARQKVRRQQEQPSCPVLSYPHPARPVGASPLRCAYPRLLTVDWRQC